MNRKKPADKSSPREIHDTLTSSKKKQVRPLRGPPTGNGPWKKIADSAAPSAGALHKGSGGILIMDDEEIIRKVLGDILRRFGYTVTCVHEGRAAIDFYNEETRAGRPLAGIFLDLTVPVGMSGRDIIREIRRSDPDIPAFVVSGYADDPIMKNPTQFGFTASLCKPFRMEELSDLLEKYVKAGK